MTVEESNDLVVGGDSPAPVVEETPVLEAGAPAVEPAVQEKEKTTEDRLNEVIEKVKKRDEAKVGDGKVAAEAKTPEEKAKIEEKPVPGVVAKEVVKYTPNLKYKVGKLNSETGKWEQTEKDIPKILQSVIKDAESEKEVRDLLTRADGLEIAKAERAQLKTERDGFQSKNAQIGTIIDDLRQTYQRNDIDSWLAKMRIPQERMLQWAIQKAEYLNLPPEQRAAIDARVNAERQAFDVTQQNNNISQVAVQQIQQARQTLLDATLMRPDFSTVASEFDTRAGRQGAFKQAIMDHGELAWNRSQGRVDLTPEQAALEVMKNYGLKMGDPAALKVVPQNGAANGAGAPTAQPAGTKKVIIPIIPNIQGGSTSPLKAKPKNVAELRKIAAEFR